MQIGDYLIKPTSDSAEKKLIDFIKFNGFKHAFKFENFLKEDNKLLRFEGIWKVTSGYCRDTPKIGNLFNKDGELIFSGKFELEIVG